MRGTSVFAMMMSLGRGLMHSLEPAAAASAGFFKTTSRSASSSPKALDRMYSSLLSIKENEIKQAASDPLSNNDLKQCLSAMNDVTLLDLGLTKDSVNRLTDAICMNIVCSSAFDISVFILPKNKKIPLHDHPEMTVLSKIISGRLSVKSFTEVGESRANMIHDEERTSEAPAWFLSATDGNIHEFEAREACVILDVLLPPYNEPERCCNFYRADKDRIFSPESSLSSSIYRLVRVKEPAVLPYTVRYTGETPASIL